MKDELKMKAKSEMLKRLKKMAMDEDFGDLGKILKGKVKKVTVAAPDEDSLEEGLSLAEKLLAKKRAMESMKSEESEESSEEESEDGECPVCGEMHDSEEFSCGGMKE